MVYQVGSLVQKAVYSTMVNSKISYQPFTNAIALGYHASYHASYHGKNRATMVRQWVVIIFNALTMVAFIKANCTRHGIVYQGNHYYAWYYSPGVICKLRSVE